MTYEEARLLLLMHGSGTVDAAGRPMEVEDGFLGSLRPYRGSIEKNFHLGMEALLTVGETLYRSLSEILPNRLHFPPYRVSSGER